MSLKKITSILIFLIVCAHYSLSAQTCTDLGQNPSTAFPVCGTASFSQSTVPFCGGRNIPAPSCPRAPFSDKNPFWYKFTCFTGGTLGFLIKPNTPEDYDWELFNVTGRNPDDVYTDASLIVAYNWSAEFQSTGTSNSLGTSLRECDGPGVNTFSSMPTLIQGHDYILLISHFTDTPNGYELSFSGGTAVITDPLNPHLTTATASCDGKIVRVKLNKKMKCKTLASNGSDFTLNTALSSIIAASGAGCSTSFDMDSVILTLNNSLAPGNYTLTIRNGVDGNTLLDNCDRAVPASENISIVVSPIAPTPMDSLRRIGCAPTVLQLVFKKPMLCSSIAANGSDFTVSGPSAVSITGATGSCANGLTSIISVQLSGPIQLGGLYRITLKNGSDGNTLLDECGQQTPAGSSINFLVSDTVNADFNYTILFGCEENTVQYSHNGRNGITSWNWNFDNSSTSIAQNPLMRYTDFFPKNTSLIVSNGVCSDTAAVSIVFDNLLDAAFEGPEFVCPNDATVFLNKSKGTITGYDWTFGNGNSSNQQNPPAQMYPVPVFTTEETVRLQITNRYGCTDTATQIIKVVNNCYIAVPSAFTPNGDGLNDYLYPLNAYKARDLSFSVYNRFGQRIFFTRNWLNKWDGTFKGQGADTGTYVWILTYTHTDTNKKVEQKGTTILIR